MQHISLRIFGAISMLLCCISCQKETIESTQEPVYPAGFPSIVFPTDNTPTVERVLLGKKLFYSTALSRNNQLSCASCHLPQFAFADTVAFSKGVEGRIGKRNTPTIANVAYQTDLLFEGSVPDLERQVFVPIMAHHEFDFDINLIAERLNEQNDIVLLSEKAYQRPPDPFVITRAIAAFERSLLSGNSPYDRYALQQQTYAMSESQQRGHQLFLSDSLACATCHSGFLFTDQSFQNNGLYEIYPDSGRIHFTRKNEDLAKFKVPSLRNIAQTAPYMHDGSKKTLSEVVEHYAMGGKQHPSKSPLLRGFSLTEQQKNDLIQFLYALTDTSFCQNPLLLP